MQHGTKTTKKNSQVKFAEGLSEPFRILPKTTYESSENLQDGGWVRVLGCRTFVHVVGHHISRLHINCTSCTVSPKESKQSTSGLTSHYKIN